MKITVDEFCELTSCKRISAYGFLSWLKDMGLVEMEKFKRPGQTRGKPAHYYDFSDAALPDKMRQALEDLVENIASYKEDESDQVFPLEVATEEEKPEESVTEGEVSELGEVGETEEEMEMESESVRDPDEMLLDPDQEYLVS